jgi:hypothetical protein
MYLQKVINRYKEATKNEKSTCCSIAGCENNCVICPNYKIRVNKITMKLIEQEIKSQGKLTKQWKYYSLWQEIVYISTELNNLGLSLMNINVNENENDFEKVTTILQKSKQAIAKLEIKKLTKEK